MIEFIAKLVVDLSDQKLYAYNFNNQVIKTMLVSTGKKNSPTPLGKYEIESKYESTVLIGVDYKIPSNHVMCLGGKNIPSDMYCIHPTPPGTPTLGIPLSRGCVRVKPSDSKWLFNATKIGTPVIIQP